MSDCLFCRIARKEIPADVLYEDDDMLAFRDINPQAPIHFLCIPKKHIDSLATLDPVDEGLLAHLMTVAGRIAASEGLSTNGYRVVTNIGRDGGQSVPHLHFHVLGGRSLTWPPG